MIRLSFLILSMFAFTAGAFSQQSQANVWNHHQCAVVLTYDDGLNVHLDKVIPSLDSTGLKGTFYIPGNARTISDRMSEWRDAASNGHELGNHTLFHPCNGSKPGREWVNNDYNLDQYSLSRFMDEIRVSNTILSMIDGKEVRTFAYTCGDMQAGKDSIYESIQGSFISARGVVSRLETMQKVDLYNTGAFMMNGQSADEMITLVKKAMEAHSLIVFLFHGVAGEHSLNVSLKDHNGLLHFLKGHQDEIWVTTFSEMSLFLKSSKDELN